MKPIAQSVSPNAELVQKSLGAAALNLSIGVKNDPSPVTKRALARVGRGGQPRALCARFTEGGVRLRSQSHTKVTSYLQNLEMETGRRWCVYLCFCLRSQ